MKKSYLMIFVLLALFCFSPGVAATTAWDGTTDTDWYNTTDKSFTVTTPEQLAGLAQIVNGTALGITADNFSGKTVTLGADLDLGGVYENNAWNDVTSKKWTPIGLSVATAFAGTFHGAGYAIDNLYINATVAGQGLFGYTATTAIVKNFVIESGSITSNKNYLGAIAGNHKGLIQNCQNKIAVSGANYCGGITGGNTGYIINSCNTGTIVSTGNRVGGIAGESTGNINRCYNTADVSTSSASSSAYIGGLTGGGVSTIIRSYSSGNVVGKGTYCGGICGFEDFSKNGTYSDCYYLKTDTVNNKLFAIGLSKTPTSDFTGTASKKEAELKALAPQLGSAFTADTENRNNGYPLLKWQVTGEYDGEETEGLAIDSVTVAADGKKIIINMNKALTHTTLTLTDFTGSYTNNGHSFTLDSAGTSQNNFGTVTTVSYKVSLRAESSGSVTAQYKDQAAVTADYTVDPSTLWIDYAATSFDGGNGTLNNPYQIKTGEQLAFLAAQVEAGVNYSGVYFVQTADIDLGASLNGEGELTGRNWVPIGYSTKPVQGAGVDLYFSGNYDGQNHAISGMVVAPAQTVYTYSYAGMFGFTQNARILNIQLISPQISVKNYNAAGLIAYAVDTSVKNCHLLGGVVTSTGATGLRGGLIAHVKSTAKNAAGTMRIAACSSSATVQSPGMAGGLIGTCSFAQVTNNQVTTTGYVSIEDCRATGSVTGNGIIGGIVGSVDIIYAVSIDHCYVSGDLTSAAAANAGGILGYARTDPNSKYRVTDVRITNCAALNTRITYTGTGEATDYDRIVGNGAAGLQTDFLTLENNNALELLTINGAMIDCADGDSASGASRTKEDLALVETWNSLSFDFSDQGPWHWDDDAALPMLRYTLADYAIDIVTQPLNATAYLNKDAVFRVQSSNGVGNHSYQWQNSPDGETWTDLDDETDTLLQVSGDKTLNGYQYRCVIRDEGGQTANSNAATLTVKSKKYTAEDAAANLYARYLQSGVMSHIKEPSSLYAYRQDLSSFTNELKYYGDYYVGGTVSNKLHGGQPWAFLDELAVGDNPRNYLKTGGNGDTTADLVAEFLAKQQADGSFKMETYYDNEVDLINYVLALEIYFGGNTTWGNEASEGHYGRAGALDYLFSQVKEDDASDGKYFYSLSPNPQGNLRAADVQRYQAEFAILLSRLLSDADYGKKAKDTLYGVMDYLDYIYINGEITSTEVQGRYLSALIAAANATNNHLKQNAYYNQADAVYTSLQTALALDGTYTAQINTTLAESGNPDATAAVMMGLGDYVNDNCSLATMGHTSSDEERLGADLSGISLPDETLTDLVLPQQGAYGTTFTWKSSAPHCITATGAVTRQTTDTTVILTVTGTNGEATASRTFTVTVAAARSADGDMVATAIANLKHTIPSETVSSLALPTKTHEAEEDEDKNVTISWETSDSALLGADGTVTRPAQGSADGNVVLTATLTKGSVTQKVDFPILVYAETGDSLTESYYETRVYYLTHRDLSSGYWQAFAAYAALGGDFIQDPANGYTFYDVSKHKLGMTWQGTDYGAVLLQIMAMGENPYDYNGVNYVKIAEKAGTGGPYASPIFATMGLEAVGAKNYSPATSYSIGQLKESAMTYGVDIAGWAVIALSRHLGEPGVDAAIEHFAAIMKANQSEKGYFVYNSMGIDLISTGCVVSGFTALLAAGLDSYDVTADPWLANNVSCIDSMYIDGKNNVAGQFGVQLQIEIADLYNTKYNGGNVMWIACGVTKDKLETQIDKANAILADQDQYTKASIDALESALATVNAISNDRLNANIADYGEEYF
ncbi:MAG TPA: hypothetical protein PKD52_12490, partial [Clostridiales bacterium]|nr:hypothetical protein [Clostridiales bacterium]